MDSGVSLHVCRFNVCYHQRRKLSRAESPSVCACACAACAHVQSVLTGVAVTLEKNLPAAPVLKKYRPDFVQIWESFGSCQEAKESIFKMC